MPSVTPQAELSDHALYGHEATQERPADATVPAGRGKAAETEKSDTGNKEKEHVAASLLEILAQPDSAINPHVRAMAMDTLQALLPEIGTPGFLRMLARRLCLMERPPASLLRTLLAGNDREIVRTLLLDARMPESLLVEIATWSEPEVLHVLARRRMLSTAVCNALLKRDEPGIMLELLRNRNAVIEEQGYWAVVRRAREEHSLHAPLVTREDLPAAVAFDLFWHLPPMQRRFVISRFVSDSDMLERILKITRPAATGLDATDRAMYIETMVAMICDGDTDAAARRLSRLTGLHAEACLRIVSDASGEALTITFKALGLQRRVFTDVIARLHNAPAAPLDGHREIEDLRILFDTLSTNKSWVMLTYWDWSARGIGPYSDRDIAPEQPDGVAMPGAAAPASAPGAGKRQDGKNGPAPTSPEHDRQPETVAREEKKRPESPEQAENGSEECANGANDLRDGEPTSEFALPVMDGLTASGQQEQKPAEAEEKAFSQIGREELEEIAETENGRNLEEDDPQSMSVKERAAAPGDEAGHREDGPDADENDDDPLARIDALLRQLQKAARGNDRKRDEKAAEGKVA